MNRVKNIFWYMYQLFAIYSVAVICLLLWTPFSHWIAAFMMISFPITVLLNFAALFFLLLIDVKKAVVPVIMLCFSCFFLPRTFVFGQNDKEGTIERTFKVVNYNIKNLRVNEAKYRERASDTDGLQKWVFNSRADIICLPEYYSERSNGNLPTTKQLIRRNYRFYRTLRGTKSNYTDAYMGLALFSKYPIVDSKDTVFEAQNGLIRADILINSDTVRVIGVHLFSMALRLDLIVQKQEMTGLKNQTETVIKRIKNGFEHRSNELKVLESWINTSPFPVIVCGDFNETAYGFVYGKLRNLLSNSFEEKGDGFGFTYNHLPYFIRIDHQFYDETKIKLVNFNTVDSIPYSDHYPLVGTYQIKTIK